MRCTPARETTGASFFFFFKFPLLPLPLLLLLRELLKNRKDKKDEEPNFHLPRDGVTRAFFLFFFLSSPFPSLRCLN